MLLKTYNTLLATYIVEELCISYISHACGHVCSVALMETHKLCTHTTVVKPSHVVLTRKIQWQYVQVQGVCVFYWRVS